LAYVLVIISSVANLADSTPFAEFFGRKLGLNELAVEGVGAVGKKIIKKRLARALVL
jgi:hypothetical protein